jgi:putative holliday junction resolvase
VGSVVLGLDVGRARIGVARAERGTGLAFGRGAIDRRGTVADIEAVRALADAEGADLVVVGLPRPTRGQDSSQTRLVRTFAEALSRAGMDVIFEDERFTTALSERQLREAALPRGKRRAKGAVDEASAILILESYLARTNAATARGGPSERNGPATDPDPDAEPGDAGER